MTAVTSVEARVGLPYEGPNLYFQMCKDNFSIFFFFVFTAKGMAIIMIIAIRLKISKLKYIG